VAAHRPSGTLVEPHRRGVGRDALGGRGPTPSGGVDVTGAAASPPRSLRAPRRQPTALGDGHEWAPRANRGFCPWARGDSNPRLPPWKNPATPPPGDMRPPLHHLALSQTPRPARPLANVAKPPRPATLPTPGMSTPTAAARHGHEPRDPGRSSRSTMPSACDGTGTTGVCQRDASTAARCCVDRGFTASRIVTPEARAALGRSQR
jgi:hypothetical protein